MFPTGMPGVALLVLRTCIAIALFGSAFPLGWRHDLFVVPLTMLCIGLLTPAACVIAVCAVLLDIPNLRELHTPNLAIVLLSTLSLAFLGPGNLSLDARLFGRRVLVSSSATEADR